MPIIWTPIDSAPANIIVQVILTSGTTLDAFTKGDPTTEHSDWFDEAGNELPMPVGWKPK